MNMMAPPYESRVETNDLPRTQVQREEILADPGFGSTFTDHMFIADWTSEQGWHDPRVVPYAPLMLDPATAVLHYAQEVFEGLKRSEERRVGKECGSRRARGDVRRRDS